MYHILQRYVQKPYVTYKDTKLKLVGRIGNQYTLFDAAETDIYPGDYVMVQVDMLFPHESRKVV